MTTKEMWMEDVKSMTLDVHDHIEKLLYEFGVDLQKDVKLSDFIYDKIWTIFEDLSNGNYRHHM